jgi:tetratricopeptide (TPR) repeat protein/DNA-binding CsgD family transcriptional regulator
MLMLPLNIYYAHLETLNGIRFTPREIDVIACILNGRSAKTIPVLLSIAPKTVAAHIENIRSKAGCSSRESIIDFIEASEKCALIKNEYYLSLLTQNSFEKALQELSKIASPHVCVCSLIYEQGNNTTLSLVHHLKQHLSLAGFKVKSVVQKEPKPLEQSSGETTGYTLYILPNAGHLDESQLKLGGKEIFIFLEDQAPSKPTKEVSKQQYVNFSEQKNYYSSFLEILKIIYSPKNIDKYFNEFKQHLHDRRPIEKSPDRLASSQDKAEAPSYRIPRFLRKTLGYATLAIALSVGLFFAYDYLPKGNKPTTNHVKKVASIRSDLAIPTPSTLLKRSNIIAQFDNKFKEHEGIQTLALIGVGGAGKTTLARQYAQQQNADVIWEMNAETRGDLNASFEKLGTALSTTDQEKRELKAIQSITNSQEREEALIHFIKVRLKVLSQWVLIFDNVEQLTDIQNYFPQDPQAWGTGKVILTTRDHNFQNSSQINHVLFVEELDPTEKIKLFAQIMKHGSGMPFTPAQKEEALQFLEKLPPFPLDISLAAYYLKSANATYVEYLDQLRQHRENFESFQGNILKEIGGYTKTRHGIVSLSLQEIMTSSKEFADLFLLISLLNAHNIPRDLLEKYKDSISVADFIYHLNKYSLMLEAPKTVLSLHHSTQDIALPYLLKHLGVTKNSPVLQKIANVLDDYMDRIIEEEDFPKMRMMVGHLEKILERSELLTDLSRGFLKSKLASLYYFVNDDRASKALAQSLEIVSIQNLAHLSSEDKSRLARSLVHIGAVYTELRLDEKAKASLEKALSIYEKEKVRNHADLSWALTHLGNVYRRTGNYEKAREYLEESLQLHKQYGLDKKRMAHTLAYLGGAYRGLLGRHQKAIESLEESLTLYNKNFPHDHFRVGWILSQLGNIYRDLGESKKAKKHFEQSLSIYKKHLPKDHLNVGLALAYLGNCCRELGEYEKSREHLEQSLKIHQKHFDEKHVRRGWILFHLASTYKAVGKHKEVMALYDKILAIYAKHSHEDSLNNVRLLRNMAEIFVEKNRLDDAEKLMKKHVKLLQAHNHAKTYESLELLGGVYLLKSASYTKNSQESQNLKSQALKQFNQALKIAERHFPQHSIHIQRLRSKLKTL